MDFILIFKSYDVREGYYNATQLLNVYVSLSMS